MKYDKKYNFLALLLLLLFVCYTFTASAQSTKKKYLSGTDKDHTVEWEFRVDGGRHSGQWTTIPVPSQWELQGFDTYN